MTSARERENGSRGIKKVRYSVENEEVEQLKVEDGEGNAMAGARTTPSSKVDLWSKSALEAQLETPRVGGKGFASSKVAPYMPLGTPDVKRDRSLLPKEFKFYHSYSVEVEEANTIEGVPDDMEPLVLPTRLKGCYWNGERWCGTPFLPRLASACNGFEFLRQEIGKSHKHLIACRMGKYFMKGVNMMETKLQTDKEKIISKSLKRPSIPRLNLRVIPAFQYSDQLAKNAALIFAYRNEAKRLSSTRSTAVTSRCLYQNGEIVSQIKSPTERAHNTIPAKAVEDTSLRQLSNILDKETRFTAVQEKLNSHLKQVVRAIDSVRPFSYTCQYSSLQHLSPAQQSWDNRPTASPHKVELFRTNLESHKWYEELIETMFVEYRCPSKPELVILAQISHILEKGLQFGSNEYIDLLKYLQTKGIDLNDSATSRALILIRYALKVSDEVLLEEFLRKCTVIPAFLSSIDVPKNYSRLSSRLSSASKGQGT